MESPFLLVEGQLNTCVFQIQCTWLHLFASRIAKKHGILFLVSVQWLPCSFSQLLRIDHGNFEILWHSLTFLQELLPIPSGKHGIMAHKDSSSILLQPLMSTWGLFNTACAQDKFTRCQKFQVVKFSWVSENHEKFSPRNFYTQIFSNVKISTYTVFLATALTNKMVI